MNKIHALLVGVSEYEAQEWRLECPPEDARKLAGVLEEHYGADTVCLDARDLDAGKLERELKALCKKSKAGDTVLFFFSGHGRVVNDKHYLLLPGFDAELLQRGETSSGVFTLGSLEKFTRKPGVQRLFIFDACRTRQKVGERGQHHGAPDTGVVQRIGIAKDLNLANSADVEQDYVEWHACGDNQISLEWSRKQGGPGHSLFASALIKRLRDAANRGQAFRVDESVGKVLRQDVRALARQIQREADCGLPELSLKSCVQGIELAALRKSATENVGVGSSHDERQWLMLLDDLEFVGSAEEKIALLRAHINDPSISGCVHVEEVRERILALRQQIAGQGPVEAEAQARLESDRMADEQAKVEQHLDEHDPNKRIKQFALAAVVAVVGGVAVMIWGRQVFVPVPERYAVRSEFRAVSGNEASPLMVVLPSDRFTMGSPKGESGRTDYEGPQHEVRIGYKLAVGKYEVTFAEWDACVAGGGCGGYKPGDEGWGRGTRPVINVSWEDAQAYLKWLNQKAGLSESSPNRHRLLSEAEWEYACRAGGTHRYCGSNDVNAVAWGPDKSGDKIHPVSQKAPNDWGLYDMSGNAWEWVEDGWHDNYNGAPNDGSVWTSGADTDWRVLRGGSWLGNPVSLRSANRVINSPANRLSIDGFRIARTLP